MTQQIPEPIAERLKLTAQYLKKLMSYDPETGLFTSLCNRGGRTPVGSVLGHPPDKRGHIDIVIDGVHYKAHRLAWLYMTGEWPPMGIDHKDIVGSNNRWSNLRLATQSQNMHNVRRRSNNKSGSKGVGRHFGGWYANIRIGNRRLWLGTFKQKEKAVAAYAAAEIEHFGEFAGPWR